MPAHIALIENTNADAMTSQPKRLNRRVKTRSSRRPLRLTRGLSDVTHLTINPNTAHAMSTCPNIGSFCPSHSAADDHRKMAVVGSAHPLNQA